MAGNSTECRAAAGTSSRKETEPQGLTEQQKPARLRSIETTSKEPAANQQSRTRCETIRAAGRNMRKACKGTEQQSRAASDASEKKQIPRKAARIQANQQQRAASRTKPSRAARVASAAQRAAPAAPARKASRSRAGVPRGKRAARRVGGCLA